MIHHVPVSLRAANHLLQILLEHPLQVDQFGIKPAGKLGFSKAFAKPGQVFSYPAGGFAITFEQEFECLEKILMMAVLPIGQLVPERKCSVGCRRENQHRHPTGEQFRGDVRLALRIVQYLAKTLDFIEDDKVRMEMPECHPLHHAP